MGKDELYNCFCKKEVGSAGHQETGHLEVGVCPSESCKLSLL